MVNDLWQLLKQCEKQGIELSTDGDKLKYRAPEKQMTPEILNQIKSHKNEIISIINDDLNLSKQDPKAHLPLSYAQQRLWFLQQLDPTNIFYNVPLIAWIEGELNITALEQAINAVIERHDILRSRYPSEHGQPYVSIMDDFNLKIERLHQHNQQMTDEQAYQSIISAAKKPFDINHGPLITAKIASVNKTRHLFLLNTHHLVTDGWSLKILSQEISQFYRQYTEGSVNTLPKLDIQYTDFSHWQKSWVCTQAVRSQLDYWRKQCEDLPMLNLPYDYPRPKKVHFHGDMLNFTLPIEFANWIEKASKEFQVSEFVLAYTLITILLSQYGNQDDVVLAVPVSNRPHKATEHLIGTFMNSLILRNQVDQALSFEAFAKKSRGVVLDAFDNQALPFDILVNELNPERIVNESALFNVLFLYEHENSSAINLPGLKTRDVNLPLGTARFDLLILLAKTENGIEGAIEYSTELFKKSTIERFVSDLNNLFDFFYANQAGYLEDYFLQSSKPLSFAPQAVEDTDNLNTAFINAVQKYATRPAIRYLDETLTFESFEQQVHQYASAFVANGAEQGDVIAVCLTSSIDAIVAMFAICRLGCVYLPLDPYYPQKRLDMIMTDASAKFIIASDDIKDLKQPILTIENIHSHQALDPHKIYPTSISPYATAYIIYTSGSTGKPKGVEVAHHSVINLIRALETAIYQQHPSCKNILLNGSLTFDTSIKQIFQILNGRTLHLIPYEIKYNGIEFVRYLEQQQIDAFDCTPTQCKLLLDAGLNHLQRHLILLLGGEAVSEETWSCLAKNKALSAYNLYGPTEATVDTTVARISLDSKPNIGHVLDNVHVLVLDRHQNPVPNGVVGEMVIAGRGVAKGYVNDVAHTQEKFVKIKMNGDELRCYKTGDLAKYNEDGALIFYGRADDQVKICGYRVEPAEIESLLTKHPSIKQAVVSVYHDGKAKLGCAVVADKASAPVVQGYQRYRLPNKLAIAHLNKNETDFIYNDIFVNKAYLKHGIHVKPGATIIDVGTNIGLFSLQAHMSAPDIKIYGFEPNPKIYDIARLNCDLYDVNAELFDYALSHTHEDLDFTFYENMSFLSGVHADIHEEKELVRSYLRKQGATGMIEDAQIEAIIEQKFREFKIPVRAITLSSFIHEQQIQKIDLLKINVEKAELDVIRGIQANDWGKIDQIVLEVHDFDDRLSVIKTMLEAHGFEFTIDKDWSLDSAQNIYYVYAKKRHVKEIKHDYHPKLPEILTEDELKTYCGTYLSHYMMPKHFVIMENIPLNSHQKVDRARLADEYKKTVAKPASMPTSDDVATQIKQIWEDILECEVDSYEHNFFDLGGHSLLLAVMHDRIKSQFDTDLSLLDLFEFTTIQAIAKRLKGEKQFDKTTDEPVSQMDRDIAIIGIAGIYPKSDNIREFWQHLVDSDELISDLSEDMLYESGAQAFKEDKNYIKRKAYLEDSDKFDAAFFNYSPKEAELLDPQQRKFLECCWHALEDAGYTHTSQKVGLIAGQTVSTYFLMNLLPQLNPAEAMKTFQAMLANGQDHLALRTAYKLNLRGPALTVQTACSTSLVATHLAAQSILNNECDVCMAGGVSITVPVKGGYWYSEQGIFSPDGKCKAFDNAADGTSVGNGVGVVVLKRLSSAIRDRDHIYAVIKGSAINNDGEEKIGYTAPSVSGQSEVIEMALKRANVEPESIKYIETHGTGTPLGDPIELNALNKVFRFNTEDKIALGSVKTNIGHLDAAAGITSLLKATLSIYHRCVPPNLNFTNGNQKFNWQKGPFTVVTKNQNPWCQSEIPRRAGVSAFGLGGTNAHVILEQAPTHSQPDRAHRAFNIIPISAKSISAHQRLDSEIKQYIENEHSQISDICYSMQRRAQKSFPFRTCYLTKDNQILSHSAQVEVPKSKIVLTISPFDQSMMRQIEQHYHDDVLFQRLYDDIEIRTKKHVGAKHINVENVRQFTAQLALMQYLIKHGICPDRINTMGTGILVSAYLSGDVSFEFCLDTLAGKRSTYIKAESSQLPHLDYPLKNQLKRMDWTSILNEPGEMFYSSGDLDDYVEIKITTQKTSADLLGDLLFEQAFVALVARLWLAGFDINWHEFNKDYAGYHIPLPLYPFDKTSYWIDAQADASIKNAQTTVSSTISIRDALKDIWQELLGVNQIKYEDDFFALGGDSMIGLQLQEQLQSQLNLDVPMLSIYEHHTIEKMAAYIEANNNKS